MNTMAPSSRRIPPDKQFTDTVTVATSGMAGKASGRLHRVSFSNEVEVALDSGEIWREEFENVEESNVLKAIRLDRSISVEQTSRYKKSHHINEKYVEVASPRRTGRLF